MGGGSVAGRETFAGHDEGGGIRSEVEEKLGQNVEGQKSSLVEMAVCETDDDKDDGEQSEAHQLDWLATNGVDSCNSDPVAWDGASANNDQVAHGGVAENFV